MTPDAFRLLVADYATAHYNNQDKEAAKIFEQISKAFDTAYSVSEALRLTVANAEDKGYSAIVWYRRGPNTFATQLGERIFVEYSGK